ncbi:MAG: hypothetical protein EHM49_01280 [Deltaproteobacteria bacterium]|nr:MAG: hypothetical protein EHM49_01280 [Deltaproteobacteria bacterium]
MTLLEAFKILPLSEITVVRHRFSWRGLVLRNNLGSPCEYTVTERGRELGMVKYYRGRKWAAYEKKEEVIGK